MRIGLLAALSAAIVLAACAGLPGGSASNVVHVDITAHEVARPAQRAGQPPRVRVAGFADARAVSGTRKIGNIRATVRDMFGTELLLDRNVESLLTEATRAQLAAEGASLVDADKEADFAVEGTVKAFSLDIAGRDDRKLAVEVTLRDARSGKVVWTDLIEEHDDRYAGVTGNSRATIAAYLEAGLAAYSARLGAGVRQHLRSSQAGAAVAAAVPAQVPAESVKSAATAVAPASGRFFVQTVPPRARVYIGDIYYGQSPLRLELPAGVATVTLKLGGYRTATEKVAIRPGETTELELPLEKQ